MSTEAACYALIASINFFPYAYATILTHEDLATNMKTIIYAKQKEVAATMVGVILLPLSDGALTNPMPTNEEDTQNHLIPYKFRLNP